MHACDVIGYAFDGTIYCPEHVPQAAETGCTCGESDENGVCLNNCHGYGPDPIFADNLEGCIGESCDEPGCGYLEGCEPPPETFTVVGYYPDTGEAFADDVSALSARAAAEEAPSGVVVLCVFAGSQTDLLAGEQ